MEITNQASDRAVLAELGQRLARMRLDLNRTQADLAREAGVSKRTLERLEAGDSTQSASLIRVLRALDLVARLEALVPAAKPSPIQRFKSQGKRRLRASGADSETPTGDEPWRWGDDT